MAAIKLMIADDHTILREGIKSLLQSEPDFHIIADAKDGKECLQKIADEIPDLLILDINMPEKNGIEVLYEIKKNHNREMKILILTGSREPAYFIQSYEIGIDGYIFKESDFTELKKAIYSVLSGKLYISSKLIPLIDEMENSIKKDIVRIESLTKRELDVLKNLTIGMYNKEIAMKLGISERTVKNHVSNIFKKIGVADRTQAAVFAIRNHIVSL